MLKWLREVPCAQVALAFLLWKAGAMKFTTLMSCLSYKVLECDWNMIRKESSRCPAAAGVAVGALLSPAAIGEMRNREHVSDMCIWNCGHICWLRPSRPLKINRGGVLDSCAAAELRRCACGVRLGQCTTNFFFIVSPRKRRSKVQPLPAGVTRIPNEGWGDCLCWSLSQGIQHTGGGSHHHRSVRAPATAHFCKHLQKIFYVLR